MEKTAEVKWTPGEEQKQTSEGLGRKAKKESGPTGDVFDVGRGPNRVQYALKENETRSGECFKAWMGTGRSVEPNQTLKEGENLSLRGLCEGRKNREAVPSGEAHHSVKGLTRVQYPSRVNGKGYGWRLKV